MEETASELKTLVLNALNPDRKISVSTVDTFDFLLIPLFWDFLTGFQSMRVLDIHNPEVFSSGSSMLLNTIICTRKSFKNSHLFSNDELRSINGYIGYHLLQEEDSLHQGQQ